MKRCLCPGNLPNPGRRALCSFHSLHRPVASCQHKSHLFLRKELPSRRQWSRPVSSKRGGDDRPTNRGLDPSTPQYHVLARHPHCPVRSREKQRDPNAWIPFLERYLAPPADAETETLYARSRGLAFDLAYARFYGKCDPIAHLGFGLDRWTDVYALLGQLLDAIDVLRDFAPRSPLSTLDWGGDSGLLIGETVTLRHMRQDLVQNKQNSPKSSSGMAIPSLDELTYRPYAEDLSRLLMAEVWQSLGFIILEAADRTPEETMLGISYVFRILARLHHSGLVSDNVYKYRRPDAHQVTFRPPAMYLLSTNIMSVLSETAWRAHEAETIAKAAAMGEESSYFPFKMGVRDLGPEIWFELILWCCAEHGYVKEGLWLLERMKDRTGDLSWNFESWKPLLNDQGVAINQTKIDSEEFWRRPGPDVPVQQGSTSFRGLARRTISLEVVLSLRDCLANYVYLGLGHRGLTPSKYLRLVSRFNGLINIPKPEEGPQPTIKESNWLTVRSLESAGLDLNADPQAFEEILRSTPYVEPPWNDKSPQIERDLERLASSQLYDDTSVFLGLIEYNIRSYCMKRQSGQAFEFFSWLQEVVDSSKSRHITRFLEQVGRSEPHNLPLPDMEDLMSQKWLESSTPQVSNATYADLLDLATTSKAFPFAEYLLFSPDVDGPPIRRGEYGNQTLAPSIIRLAATIRNTALYRQVVTSMRQPYSLNTLRALINYAVIRGEWDRVVPMLEFVRDNRLKSWGHSNVTALAGSILRMNKALQNPAGNMTLEERHSHLAKAKHLLLRILNGEFNDLSERTANNKFQQRAVRNIHRVLLSIPGPLAEIASKSRLARYQFRFHKNSEITSGNFPYIPSVAFHNLLLAVVEVHGCSAGKRFFEQWCLDPASPTFKRFHEGGITRLYEASERNPLKGDPHFDHAWFTQVYQKATIPNLNTVRIITQAAVREYSRWRQGLANQLKETIPTTADADADIELAASSSPPSPSPIPTNEKQETPEQVLDFCVHQFKILRLPEDEINRETFNHLIRIQKRAGEEKKSAERSRQLEKERIKEFYKSELRGSQEVGLG